MAERHCERCNTRMAPFRWRRRDNRADLVCPGCSTSPQPTEGAWGAIAPPPTPEKVSLGAEGARHEAGWKQRTAGEWVLPEAGIVIQEYSAGYTPYQPEYAVEHWTPTLAGVLRVIERRFTDLDEAKAAGESFARDPGAWKAIHKTLNRDEQAYYRHTLRKRGTRHEAIGDDPNYLRSALLRHAGLERSSVHEVFSPPDPRAEAAWIATLSAQDRARVRRVEGPGMVVLAVGEPLSTVAHDVGDGFKVSHCFNCGSGQIVGRSDGTVTCSFCRVNFTIQVQPEHPAMPQTVNGQPVDMAGTLPESLEKVEDETVPQPPVKDEVVSKDPFGSDIPGQRKVPPSKANPFGNEPQRGPWFGSESSRRQAVTRRTPRRVRLADGREGDVIGTNPNGTPTPDLRVQPDGVTTYEGLVTVPQATVEVLSWDEEVVVERTQEQAQREQVDSWMRQQWSDRPTTNCPHCGAVKPVAATSCPSCKRKTGSYRTSTGKALAPEPYMAHLAATFAPPQARTQVTAAIRQTLRPTAGHRYDPQGFSYEEGLCVQCYRPTPMAIACSREPKTDNGPHEVRDPDIEYRYDVVCFGCCGHNHA